MKGLVQLLGAAIFLLCAYMLNPYFAGMVVGCYLVWLGRVA